MNKQALKALEDVKPGDLICVDWCDASTGKSSMNGSAIDVPVRSWGVFLGIMEQHNLSKVMTYVCIDQFFVRLSDIEKLFKKTISTY